METLTDISLFAKQVKYTNLPWYSQLYSLGKAQKMRIEYEKTHNKKYDFIFRSRTDVQLHIKDDLRKLKEIKNHYDKTYNGPWNNIYFPSLFIKNHKRSMELIQQKLTYELPIHVEYCHFMGNSRLFTNDLFGDYYQDVMEYMLQIKNKRTGIFQPTSHTFFPWLIMKRLTCRISVGVPSVKHKLLQQPNLEHQLLKDSDPRKQRLNDKK